MGIRIQCDDRLVVSTSMRYMHMHVQLVTRTTMASRPQKVTVTVTNHTHIYVRTHARANHRKYASRTNIAIAHTRSYIYMRAKKHYTCTSACALVTRTRLPTCFHTNHATSTDRNYRLYQSEHNIHASSQKSCPCIWRLICMALGRQLGATKRKQTRERPAASSTYTRTHHYQHKSNNYTLQITSTVNPTMTE